MLFLKTQLDSINSSAIIHFSISENVFHQSSSQSRTEQYNRASHHISHIPQGSQQNRLLHIRNIYSKITSPTQDNQVYILNNRKTNQKAASQLFCSPFVTVCRFPKPKDTRTQIVISKYLLQNFAALKGEKKKTKKHTVSHKSVQRITGCFKRGKNHVVRIVQRFKKNNQCCA